MGNSIEASAIRRLKWENDYDVVIWERFNWREPLLTLNPVEARELRDNINQALERIEEDRDGH